MVTQHERLHSLAVGVGLRSPHYKNILEKSELQSVFLPDFVELHAENFFSNGGASHQLLRDVREQFPLSIHGTGLGLGSDLGIPLDHVKKLNRLNTEYNPHLLSDHAAFSLGSLEGQTIHGGDLLPVEFTKQSLLTFERNINQVQDLVGRRLLIENITTYLPKNFYLSNGEPLQHHEFSETEFLVEICERTGCGILVDLNNLVVNAVNQQEPHIQAYIYEWISQIPSHLVGEFHLAGCSPVELGEVMVDDHSTAITSDVWKAYETALQLIGPRPTLLEWDTNLPSWNELLNEAQKIREFAQQALIHEVQ